MDLAVAGLSVLVQRNKLECCILFAPAEFDIRSSECGPMHRSNLRLDGAMRTSSSTRMNVNGSESREMREFVGKRSRTRPVTG